MLKLADPFEQKVINFYVIKLITNVIHLPMYILCVTSRSFVTHTHACTHMCTHNKTVITVSKVTMCRDRLDAGGFRRVEETILLLTWHEVQDTELHMRIRSYKKHY